MIDVTRTVQRDPTEVFREPSPQAPGVMQGIGSKLYSVVHLISGLATSIRKIIEYVSARLFTSDDDAGSISAKDMYDKIQNKVINRRAEIDTANQNGHIEQIIEVLETRGVTEEFSKKLKELKKIAPRMVTEYDKLKEECSSSEQKKKAIEFFSKLLPSKNDGKSDEPDFLFDPFTIEIVAKIKKEIKDNQSIIKAIVNGLQNDKGNPIDGLTVKFWRTLDKLPRRINEGYSREYQALIGKYMGRPAKICSETINFFERLLDQIKD